MKAIKHWKVILGALIGIIPSVFLVHYILASSPVTDSFTDTSKIASNENLTVDTGNGNVKLALSLDFTCGDTFTDTRDSQTYATVLISGQCWMAKNMNVGTKVTGVTTQGISCASAAAINKYCYSDSDANCTTYGGLYQWDQAMCSSTTAGAQGICPVGWHIPTHDQFTTLERAVCSSGTCATDFPLDTTTTGYRGTNEGTSLKSGGASGFAGLLAGYRDTNGSFGNVGSGTLFWSSVQSSASAWSRNLVSGEARVNRNPDAKANGFSVRCLKD